MNTFACRSLRRLDLLGANSREGDRYAGLRSLRNICVVKILKILNFLKSFGKLDWGMVVTVSEWKHNSVVILP
jgi:hypothetical protein